MAMDKIKVTQDTLYEYIQAHDVKLSRLAELMDRVPEVVISCFNHNKNQHGNPRSFNAEHADLINQALPRLAHELRKCVLKFGSPQVHTSKKGHTYDPALVEPIKDLGVYLNITAMLQRVLGWSAAKKSSILSRPTGKLYGNISNVDAVAINTEILSIAAVLDSYELEIDNDNQA